MGGTEPECARKVGSARARPALAYNPSKHLGLHRPIPRRLGRESTQHFHFHFTGVTTGAPLVLTKKAMNFAGSVALAFLETT
jgi:hypothetical protein